MEKKLIEKIEKCIEKAADDFLEGKTVDLKIFFALTEAIRSLHHFKKFEKMGRE